MGFFNNMKNLKDQALENEKIKNYEQLQGLFDAIDNQAEKEKEKDKKEREYYLPFEELPYCEAFNIDEVCNYITNTNMQEYEKKLMIFFAKYKSYDNGNASEKVAALIDELNV